MDCKTTRPSPKPIFPPDLLPEQGFGERGAATRPGCSASFLRAQVSLEHDLIGKLVPTFLRPCSGAAFFLSTHGDKISGGSSTGSHRAIWCQRSDVLSRVNERPSRAARFGPAVWSDRIRKPIGGRHGERPTEEQSREEETEAGQEEGNAGGFAIGVNRSARKAWRRRRFEETPLTLSEGLRSNSNLDSFGRRQG